MNRTAWIKRAIATFYGPFFPATVIAAVNLLTPAIRVMSLDPAIPYHVNPEPPVGHRIIFGQTGARIVDEPTSTTMLLFHPTTGASR